MLSTANSSDTLNAQAFGNKIKCREFGDLVRDWSSLGAVIQDDRLITVQEKQ